MIALVLEQGISLVLIDERRGRMVARTLGLRVTASVGVLVRAYGGEHERDAEPDEHAPR